MSLLPLQIALRALQDDQRALSSQRFFKTGPGEYGEGDLFLGLPVPMTRATVRKHESTIQLSDLPQLLNSPYHEERLAAAILLTQWSQHNRYDVEQLASFYMSHLHGINNWDLVDTSAPTVIGRYVFERITSPPSRKRYLDTCIHDSNLWKVRVGVLACFWEIAQGKTQMSIYVATHLLNHPHDLIHKAVGWMLREMGKRADQRALIEFLDKHAYEMPRTMLRYAIERLTPQQRISYMAARRAMRSNQIKA